MVSERGGVRDGQRQVGNGERGGGEWAMAMERWADGAIGARAIVNYVKFTILADICLVISCFCCIDGDFCKGGVERREF